MEAQLKLGHSTGTVGFAGGLKQGVFCGSSCPAYTTNVEEGLTAMLAPGRDWYVRFVNQACLK